MILLAIETATIAVGVSLLEEDKVLAAFTARPGRRHAETLHPAIEMLTRSVGIPLAAVDAIGVDIGPGLFTGLRVGVAAAKAFSFSLGVPLVSATSTEVIRRAVSAVDRVVVPVIDMRRAEVAFQLPGEADICVAGTDELIALLNKDASLERALLVGDGALRYREELAAGGPAEIAFGGEEFAAPDPVALGHVTRERLHRGEVCDAFALMPRYLRQADVSINWEQRDTVPAPEHTS
jgi:tRNA threonylcarbamoyladenosine biosynthesis protein TsaB